MNKGFAAILALTLLASGPARAEFLQPQAAIESNDVIVVLDANGTGQVSVAPCSDCSRLRLTVDGHTRALHNGKQVPLASARRLSGNAHRVVTVIYDVKDHTVEKLVW